eukprot:m.12045 g.12045  ORF g.12045 m.12045 type:complete len:162 (-) comp3944_c1_seq1:1298-1783(-)
MTWECPLCTLVNSQSAMRCKVCETPRGSSRRKTQSTALRSRLEEESQMLTMAVTHVDKKRTPHHENDSHPATPKQASHYSRASQHNNTKLNRRTSNGSYDNSKSNEHTNSQPSSSKKAKIKGPRATNVEVIYAPGKKVEFLTFAEPPCDTFAMNDGIAFVK